MGKIYVVIKHEMSFDWDHPRDTVLFASPYKMDCKSFIEKMDQIPKSEFVDFRTFHTDEIPIIPRARDFEEWLEEHEHVIH